MIVLAGKILQLEETNQILKSSVDSLWNHGAIESSMTRNNSLAKKNLKIFKIQNPKLTNRYRKINRHFSISDNFNENLSCLQEH
jgi:hypothetical protein